MLACRPIQDSRPQDVSKTPSSLVSSFIATDIDDFLAEEVKGPASFNCETGKGCAFEEPAMNQLINDIFGDNSITLDCNSGECMHYTNVPGYQVGPSSGGKFVCQTRRD
jgi:hypothetical protein